MTKRIVRLLRAPSVGLLLAVLLEGCASFAGYPQNYQNDADVLSADAPFLKADVRENGDAASSNGRGGLSQQEYRDAVVYSRIEVIDIYYYKFEAELNATHNGLNVAADLTTLALNGLGAVTGSAETKAALAAASGGVVGAKGAINTDLFYQKTIQSLIAQMRAARAQVLLRIETGLSNPVSKYSIDAALNDVNAYYIAGTLPSAIAQVTANAGAAQASAQNGIDALRKTEYVAPSTTGRRIIKWLWPDGDQTKPPDAKRLAKLNSWLQGYKADPRVAEIPYVLFLDQPEFEAARAKAIADLNIP